MYTWKGMLWVNVLNISIEDCSSLETPSLSLLYGHVHVGKQYSKPQHVLETVCVYLRVICLFPVPSDLQSTGLFSLVTQHDKVQVL